MLTPLLTPIAIQQDRFIEFRLPGSMWDVESDVVSNRQHKAAHLSESGCAFSISEVIPLAETPGCQIIPACQVL